MIAASLPAADSICSTVDDGEKLAVMLSMSACTCRERSGGNVCACVLPYDIVCCGGAFCVRVWAESDSAREDGGRLCLNNV